MQYRKRCSKNCHSKNGPGKYGPARTIVLSCIEILRELTIKLMRASATTRAVSRAMAMAMVRTTDRLRLMGI